jgi:type VI protein secretion system component VasF
VWSGDAGPLGRHGETKMVQIINQIVQFLQQGIAAVFRFLQLIWTWSFGQIIAVFQSNWQSLPVWKIVLLVIVIGAIAYILYKAALVLWDAVESVFKAFVALLTAFISVLPQIVIAGLIAFAGGWIIHSVNF